MGQTLITRSVDTSQFMHKPDIATENNIAVFDNVKGVKDSNLSISNIVGHDEDVEAGSAVTINANKLEGYNISSLIDLFYPVGSIYISTVNTSPAVLFGKGTWVQIKDTFLLAAGDIYSVGSTGGEASHTLSIEEMPAHTHTGATEALGTWFQYVTTDSRISKVSTSNTGSTGGGQAHNNMPPYTTVCMWKRIA